MSPGDVDGLVFVAVPSPSLVGHIALTALLWSVLSLYLAGTLYWLYEMCRFGLWYQPPPRRYGGRDIQVRIFTVNNESVVRDTVARLPPSFDDRYVIAEEPIDVPGAEVRVVPASFECDATNKARALEWARRSIPCDREYVLFLDEDSHILEFGGLPDADIVQFNERPRRTASWLTYFCEINRIGFQIEQLAFPSLDVPLYAWGGGLAIRSSLEDEITWNYPTVIEDTTFLWRAFADHEDGVSLAFITDRMSNQAPLTVPEFGCSSVFDEGRHPDLKADWIADAFALFGDRDVRLASWFNATKETDWSVFADAADSGRYPATVSVDGRSYGAYPTFRRAAIRFVDA